MKPIPVLAAIFTALVLVACNPLQEKTSAEAAVNQFHALCDQGSFDQVYNAAHPEFKSATQQKDFVALLKAVSRKLGKLQSSNETSFNFHSVNLTTDVTLVYTSKYAGGDAVETFDFRLQNNQPLLHNYRIDSQALIVK